MRIPSSLTVRIAAGLLMAAFLGAVGYQVFHRSNPDSPEALLKRADKMSWLNNWIGAAPLYHQAELQFLNRHQSSKALYARVSQMLAHSESSTSIPSQIAVLRQDLTLPAARDPATRLRILTILGMLETNYDASMARKTWAEVETLAVQQHHFLLASRAVGEQGIAAFLLGDMKTAKKDVLRAWMVAKFTDPAAHVRYASIYGAGLVQLHKYKQALGALNQAIHVAHNTPGVAYPTIAITAKIEALSGLGENQQALTLASAEMQKFTAYHLAGHLYELYQTRATVYEHMGRWGEAVSDLQQSAQYAKHLTYWRGLTQVDGLLAQAYLHEGALRPALVAIDEAIDANKKIPDELYFVPRNLGIKAEIMARLGNVKASNALYEKSDDLLDALFSRVPTPNVERQLLNDLSMVYSGYFVSLCNQGRIADAFRVIERARGRIEAQKLSHREVLEPHNPSQAELRLTKLNLELLNTANSAARVHILHAIYGTEQQLGDATPLYDTPPEPVTLSQLQHDLLSSQLLVEYVLAKPRSYALAVTRESAHRYALPARSALDPEATKYRSELIKQKADPALAQWLFHNLLGAIPGYKQHPDLIIVPDGKLQLLPFAALMNKGQYILASHVVTVAPSGTVFNMILHRAGEHLHDDLPYLGVAAWISKAPSTSLLTMVHRTISGPPHAKLVALPASRYEVETIADDLPKPSTILLGSHATLPDFEQLPLGQYNVIDLALHGYVDPEFSDRSALVFAPARMPFNDGYLQVIAIKRLHLNASLVTLSACNTGVGPVGEDGVNNIVNAFIDAGAQSVVSTLWAVEDQATAHFMAVFYHHLALNEDKAGALRQAQLNMLHSGAPPYFWAGFELDGEPGNSLFHKPETDTLSKGGNRREALQ
ncbi:MAG TPA: CHAT domain-containing tetratricopeptide repeat protein [Edaphobacter sp.]|uniref:CHAT domain-containing protein n=1 Tax=Edaphobacter sp. TaxID=1934404 RepID=UPI002C0A5BA9|nr:CHAT domain-containing tetratricopeptide repeat protein [Edaphobacter sp.]HUZ95033.1 CHAT domain-containing tetratricopeptide repeat protein [Edaphobacter sp.]